MNTNAQLPRSRSAQDAASSAVSPEHPWPGLMPFTEEAQAYFHGRETEAAELLRLIKRETLTVLFGQSGLGKSSLLHAGLFPQLRAEEFLPVYVRLDVSAQALPLAEQVLAAIAATCAQHSVESPGAVSGETLWEFFHRRDADFWSARNRLLTPVLVLDQFEEIFTLGRRIEDMEQRCRAFLEELGDLIEDRAPAALAQRLDLEPALAQTLDFSRHTYKVVLSFREDYLAEFEGLRDLIRSIMHNRLRLTRMNGEQAKEAVLLSGGPLVTDAVAQQIIRFVAAPRAGVRGGDELSRLEIEPALLSVVCRELNNQRLRKRQPQITTDMLQAGAQQQIIRDFYESSLAGIDPRVREFIEDQLLTEAGFRDSFAYDDALALPGVTREAIALLIARRLLRLEERSSVLRVELTHDLLTEVARESRDQRQQRDAERRKQEQETVRRRRSRRFGVIAGLATVGAIAVAVVFYVQLESSTKETKRLKETQSLGLLAQANAQLDQNVAGEAQANLAKSLELKSDNNGAIARTVSYLSQRTFPKSLARTQLRVDAADQYVSIGWQDADTIVMRTRKGTTWLAVAADGAVRGIPGRADAPDATKETPAARIVRGAPSQPTWGRTELPMTTSADGSVIAWIEDGTQALTAARVRVAWRDTAAEQDIELPHGARAPVVLAPDGRRLMVRAGHSPATMKVIVLAIEPKAASRVLHSFEVPDGSMRTGREGQVLVALDKGSVTLYDLRSDRLTVLAHRLPVNALEISPDGRMLATACQDKFARIWHTGTGSLIVAPLRHDGAVLSAAFSDDGEQLVTGALDGTARIWSSRSGDLLNEPMVTGTAVTEARLSPDGNKAFTYARNGQLGIWQIGKLQATRASVQLPSNIAVMEASSERSLAALATADNGISLWRVSATGTAGVGASLLWSTRSPESVRQIRFSPDGAVMAVATSGTSVLLLSTATGATIGQPLRHRGPVLGMRFNADSTLLATGSADGAARTWHVATQRLQGFPLLHGREAVGHVAFNHDSSLLLTGSRSGTAGSTLRVWHLNEGVVVARLPTGYHLALAGFTSAREISAVYDTTVAKWAIARRRPQTGWGASEDDGIPAYTVSGPATMQVGGLSVSAGLSLDGARVVVGGLDGTARIVDLGTMRPLGEAMKSIGVVQAVDYSYDGRWIITRSADQVARVWDGTSGYAVTDSTRHDSELSGAFLAGGGAFLVSAGKSEQLEMRRVGLDFPIPPPAPNWLAGLVEAAGGGFDQGGTMAWFPDREDRLVKLGNRVAEEREMWWSRWGVGIISRLAATDHSPITEKDK